jgi:hypothetical protein
MSSGSTAWSDRAIDQDEVPGDRIENGHGAVLSRSSTRETPHTRIGSKSLAVVVTGPLLHARLPTADQGGTSAPRLLCGGADPGCRTTGSTRAWSPDYG